MKKFKLYHKNSTEPIMQIEANSLDEARKRFASMKNLNLKAFDKVFEVK